MKLTNTVLAIAVGLSTIASTFAQANTMTISPGGPEVIARSPQKSKQSSWKRLCVKRVYRQCRSGPEPQPGAARCYRIALDQCGQSKRL